MYSVDLNCRKWTYADYLTWPDDERWELIYGMAYNQSPVSQVLHQRVVGRIFAKLACLLDRKKYEVFIAPLDVVWTDSDVLIMNNENLDIVQPDIFVIDDKKKLNDFGYNGTPVLVIEITTPETQGDDLTHKFDLYEKHGVKECWIVYPVEQVLMVYGFGADGFCKPSRYASSDKVFVSYLGDLEIDLGTIFVE